MFRGSLVALVTPMFEDGSLDLPSLQALVDYHIKEGSNALVIVGTTGESPTVSFEEHCALIQTVVSHAKGRIPIIAGTGANSTSEAIALTQCAKDGGADACLLVTPYYNKPTQEGLYLHFRAVAEAVDIPQILYNVPGRTACDLANDTALRLAAIPNITGIKDATGNIERSSDLIRRAPPDFAIYDGNDATAMALMLSGGHGVISVTANVAPRLMRQMCDFALAGDAQNARAINNQLLPLHHKLFVESNPIPVKWVLRKMGLIPAGLRLPLTPLSADFHGTLTEAMKHADITNAIL